MHQSSTNAHRPPSTHCFRPHKILCTKPEKEKYRYREKGLPTAPGPFPEHQQQTPLKARAGSDPNREDKRSVVPNQKRGNLAMILSKRASSISWSARICPATPMNVIGTALAPIRSLRAAAATRLKCSTHLSSSRPFEASSAVAVAAGGARGLSPRLCGAVLVGCAAGGGPDAVVLAAGNGKQFRLALHLRRSLDTLWRAPHEGVFWVFWATVALFFGVMLSGACQPTQDLQGGKSKADRVRPGSPAETQQSTSTR
ncbi:hypothetical protein Esti_006060 [Eimeria stiedai]